MKLPLGEWLRDTLAPRYGDDDLANRVSLELRITGNVSHSSVRLVA
jgi:hypothetical protein